ncbi:hypothetical protein [Clostridium sp.]|uniref:hypothetical protein n=1 Tax=Clostridium sp. TaxID=1506 RepID=UPI00283AE1DC|nr:hypothetical protein [Clostridium sp.]MDR3597405.1 hypothetical protein [Clostridium sp.]
MKYNDTIDLLKIFANAIFDPTSITNNLKKSATLKYSRALGSDNSINNNIYAESESSNEGYSKGVPLEDSRFYNDNNICYDKKQDTSSTPQGVIDSITQEITPVRLQQAIILSEIVGKPRSKTRKRRRF